jgi:hypothetical protein
LTLIAFLTINKAPKTYYSKKENLGDNVSAFRYFVVLFEMKNPEAMVS